MIYSFLINIIQIINYQFFHLGIALHRCYMPIYTDISQLSSKCPIHPLFLFFLSYKVIHIIVALLSLNKFERIPKHESALWAFNLQIAFIICLYSKCCSPEVSWKLVHYIQNLIIATLLLNLINLLQIDC